jgi:hypothetical protein
VRVFTFLIVAFALKSGFDEGSFAWGEDLHAHDALEDRDLREELFSHGQGEAEASSVLVAVLGGGVVLEAGEAFMEPQERSEVLVLRFADEVEHGVVAFDEGAGPAAEPTEIRIGVEVEEVGGLKAVLGSFEAQEVPHMAGPPGRYRADDLEGVGSLFVEPASVSAFGAAAARGHEPLIAGFGFAESQADQDRRLGGVGVLAEPGRCRSDFEIPGTPAELRIRRGQALDEHLGEEATFRFGFDVNGVQVNGTAIGKVTGTKPEALIRLEDSRILDAGVGVDEEDLPYQLGVLGGKQQGDRGGSGGVLPTAAHHRPGRAALLKQAGEGEVSVFYPILKFRSHRSRVYLICKLLSSAGEGTNVPSGR